MEKSKERGHGGEVFDLAIIGNGIAAQGFLWKLSQKYGQTGKKTQNFSVAHIYSKYMAPSCSLRSSATVSLNGIEEDVSALGNDMREAFSLFDELCRSFHPEGVEEVRRIVVSTNEIDTKKLLRRYKKLSLMASEKIKTEYSGVDYNSYLISPEIFMRWLEKENKIVKKDFPFFVRDLQHKDGYFELKLDDHSAVRAKKILFATGAYSKIFERFYTPLIADSFESKNAIKAGSFLERSMDLGDKSFYLSIDGHQVIYRKNSFENLLIIGSVSTMGAYEAPDLVELDHLLKKMKNVLTFDPGNLEDFKIVTGLRHKGPRRLLICEAIDTEKKVFRINGLYKNGYTLGFLAAKRMSHLIFEDEE